MMRTMQMNMGRGNRRQMLQVAVLSVKQGKIAYKLSSQRAILLISLRRTFLLFFNSRLHVAGIPKRSGHQRYKSGNVGMTLSIFGNSSTDGRTFFLARGARNRLKRPKEEQCNREDTSPKIDSVMPPFTPVASSVLSSRLSSRAQRSSPLLQQSTPSARRQSPT